jgi:hypothetical protein
MTDNSEQLPAEQRRKVRATIPAALEGRQLPRSGRPAQFRPRPPPGLLTEGPRWHAGRGELLWVDISSTDTPEMGDHLPSV